MKACFYNRKEQLVWTCTKDARYELHNGTKAVKRGASRGYLLDEKGEVIDSAYYPKAK
ncbi:hypothetical protein Q4E40_02820 [Pontibacter sp. BT731]|uniref:hypothetical protein n=1 Tax=Pontibacter coccineus TaxID=3063328 RepID=UPI0026E1A5C0|nr:hypothetical protein [Pontibacter sp. BT731]MDO6389046.1 hypothetical protein [Pontibacter sp. BT731]